MKTLKDIENITLEDLKDVSMDESIAVPEGLSERLVRNAGREVTRKRILTLSGVAAIVVLAVGLSLFKTDREPVDTFDDPYLAYAELERALAMVSEGMQKGIERTVEILK